MRPAVGDLLRSATALHAVTLWQPWGWAVAEAGKDVENRGWEPPRAALGKPLAIHAGVTYDTGGAESIREELGLSVPGRHTCARSAVVAVALLARAVRDSRSRWARPGQVHWCLEGVVRLEKPVPCKGAQGLWALPAPVLAEVRAQVLGEAAQGPLVGEVVAPSRLSKRTWSKGSARGAGPAQQHGAVRVRVGEEVDFSSLPPNCLSCGKPQERCGACGTWWCAAPGHLRHRCEEGWPRCTHGAPYWESSTGRQVPPQCCLPAEWWREVPS